MSDKAKVIRITPTSAAFLLKQSGYIVHVNTIRRWCRAGVLRGAKKIGGQWYVNPVEVEKMIAEEGQV